MEPITATEICETWWRPVYAFVRHRGFSPEEAEDLTQEFFARLIEKELYLDVRSDRGSLADFLFGCVRHFLADERDRMRAQKRGGSATRVPLEDTEFERADLRTPARCYETRWALAVLGQARERLRRHSARFERLEPMLTDWRPRQGYAEAARAMGLSETAVKVGVHRLRHRYGEVLREEMAKAAGGNDVAGEIRFLIGAVSGASATASAGCR